MPVRSLGSSVLRWPDREAVDEPFERRSLPYDLSGLPVPADLLVYTAAEWDRMSEQGGMPKTAALEMIWVFER